MPYSIPTTYSPPTSPRSRTPTRSQCTPRQTAFDPCAGRGERIATERIVDGVESEGVCERG
jgi:hypothetical protein